MKEYYFDYAGTTPIDAKALNSMLPFLKKEYGNPSTLFSKGRTAKQALEKSRDSIAKTIGAKSSEIIFTSGATEASNLAIRGVALRAQKEGWGNHLITTKIEHPSVLNTFKDLEKNYSFKATYLKVNKDGLVSLSEIEKSINNKTILVSIMYANNEIGTIQPVEKIGNLIKKINKKRAEKKLHPIYFHCDAVQAIQYFDINVEKNNLDLMSITAHKFYGPKGIGFLYIRGGSELLYQQTGGHQERGRRAGTENTALIAGMAKALEIAQKNREKEADRLRKLRDKIIREVLKMKDVKLTGHKDKRLPHIASFIIKYVEGESMLLRLDRKNIYVATGSACSSDSLEPSHVLLALGIKHEVAHGSLRISLGKNTNLEKVNYLLKNLPPIIADLRAISAVK